MYKYIFIIAVLKWISFICQINLLKAIHYKHGKIAEFFCTKLLSLKIYAQIHFAPTILHKCFMDTKMNYYMSLNANKIYLIKLEFYTIDFEDFNIKYKRDIFLRTRSHIERQSYGFHKASCSCIVLLCIGKCIWKMGLSNMNEKLFVYTGERNSHRLANALRHKLSGSCQRTFYIHARKGETEK